MPTTPTWALPYPAPTDPADVPTDMHELADAVAGGLTGLYDSTVSLDARLDVVEGAGGFVRHHAQLLKTNSMTVPDNVNTWTPVTWPSAENDAYNMHTDGTAPITPAAAGVWLLNAYVQFDQPTGAGSVALRFGIGGSGYGATRVRIPGSGGGPMFLAATLAIVASTAFQVEVNQLGQGTGWGLTAIAHRFSATRIA